MAKHAMDLIVGDKVEEGVNTKTRIALAKTWTIAFKTWTIRAPKKED